MSDVNSLACDQRMNINVQISTHVRVLPIGWVTTCQSQGGNSNNSMWSYPVNGYGASCKASALILWSYPQVGVRGQLQGGSSSICANHEAATAAFAVLPTGWGKGPATRWQQQNSLVLLPSGWVNKT